MKKIIILLLIFAIPALGIFFYFNRVSTSGLSEKDRKAAEQQILGRAIRQEKNNSLVSYNGKYISFSYPAWVAVDHRDDESVKNKPAVLELFELRDPETHLFIISQVTSTGISRLEENTDVHLRQAEQKNLYTETTVTIDGQSGLLFTKSENGYEKSLFILSDGKVYSIAASALSMQALDAVYPQILSSLKIK